jgi:hypothetical protein
MKSNCSTMELGGLASVGAELNAVIDAGATGDITAGADLNIQGCMMADEFGWDTLRLVRFGPLDPRALDPTFSLIPPRE